MSKISLNTLLVVLLLFSFSNLHAQKLELKKERIHQLDSLAQKQKWLWDKAILLNEERRAQFLAKNEKFQKEFEEQRKQQIKLFKQEQRIQDSLSLLHYDSLLTHVNFSDSATLKISNVPYTAIPKAIYTYNHLKKLSVTGTKIQHFTKELFAFSRLDTLVLADNTISTAKLPFVKNESIIYLDLGNNQLTTIPKKLKKLKQLKALKINYNQLGANGKKVKIHKLKNLEYLNLSHNQLDALPKKLHKLKYLKVLLLNENSINSLKGLEKLHGLKELELSGNPAFPDPRYLVGLDSLEKLTMHKCGLIYFPPEIEYLQNLKKLILPENKLISIPAEIGNIQSLENLMVYKNELTSVPDNIFNLKNLLWLDIYHNQIPEISEKIGQLQKLEILYLSYNKLKVLPDTIGSMIQLKELYAHHNQLRAVPDLSRLKNLKYLHLYHNHITEFPASITKLTQLEELNISDNLITEFPYEVKDLINLRFIYIEDNQTDFYSIEYEKLKAALKELNDKGVSITFDYPGRPK